MADDAAADAPRDAVSGVAALLTLPAGTVVCFLDAAGPLATVKVDKSKWVLRPAAELTAVRGPGARRCRCAPVPVVDAPRAHACRTCARNLRRTAAADTCA